jgi:hypothetical protein
MNNYDSYLTRLNEENSREIVNSVRSTVDKIFINDIKPFSYSEHKTGLLLGNVQSGKTSQVFGIVSASADEGFKIFILLTTDNIYLQQQTLSRAFRYLDTFNICGEDDFIRFKENKLRKPSIIVLKKNASVLKKWNNNLSSSGYCNGNPIFIVDDEGDAASLNTKINQDEVSAINKYLSLMKKMSSSSIYLQVTATPQALLLQTKISEWKPSFVEYFPPGEKYLGGDYFYSIDPMSPAIRITSDNELEDLLSDDEYPENGLIKALCSFLIASSHLFIKEGKNVSNFLIHPSVRTDDHEQIAEKIGSYLNRMILEIQENKFYDKIYDIWKDLKTTKNSLLPFNESYEFIKNKLQNDSIQILVMNSRNKISNYEIGLNIIVGGNSLGRGVTFPGLNTVYYCRKAKSPQADTFWQHCRIFGYDRDKDLTRVFIPAVLFKLFAELNSGNRSLIAQINKNNLDDIHLLYTGKTKPTRNNVIDQENYQIITGGTNYFPLYPVNDSTELIDELLEQFDEIDTYPANLNYFINILEKINSEEETEWNTKTYIDCIKAFAADKPGEQGVLIVRRNRDIAKSTGTLLSPNDRNLGAKYDDQIVLTLYRIIGSKSKGWSDKPIWIPNIKFPTAFNFFKMKS